MTATNLALASITATGGLRSRTFGDRCSDIINVKDYGALGDNTGAALSTRYGSLGAAQADYPFVTSTSQTIDWAAGVAASIVASVSSGQLARIMFPRGYYKFGADFVTLSPELFHGGGASWTIEGESPGSSVVYGSGNNFLFDTNPSGNIAYQTAGGFKFRNIAVNNTNSTPFTSGGLRLAGAQGVSVDCVDITGCMVGITNELVPGQRLSNTAMSITNIISSGQQRTDCIGIVMCGDGGLLSNLNLGAWQYAICFNGNGIHLTGSHFESNRVLFAMGRGGSEDGTSPVPQVPVICADVVISGVTVEGNEVTCRGYTGINNCTFINLAGQAHDIANWQGSGLDCQYGFDFTNGISGCLFLNCTLSGNAQHEMFVVGQSNPSSSVVKNKFISCSMSSLTSSSSWNIPSSGVGRAAYEFDNCNFNAYFPTASLPWDTLTGATLSGNTLTFTSGGGLTGTRGLTPISGALVTGTDVVADTRITASGTSVTGVTFDDGNGASGNTMTIHGDISGVDLGIGAVLPTNTLLVYGPQLQNMVIDGTSLTFDVGSFNASMSGTDELTLLSSVSPGGFVLQPGHRLYPDAVFGSDCYLLEQIDSTHWRINKTLTFGSTACQVEADLRAGYIPDLSTTFGYTSCAVVSRNDIGDYEVNNSQTAQAPISGAIFMRFAPAGITLSSGSGNTWTFTVSGGGGLDVGLSGFGNGVSGGLFSIPFNNTYEVNQTYGSPVGPESMTVYCDIEGCEYNVSDSATAFAMGDVMSLAGGGTDRLRVRRNDTQGGYIIVG